MKENEEEIIGCGCSCDECPGCSSDAKEEIYNCSCEEGFEDEPIIVLIDEKGNEVNFEILDSIEHNGKEYIITIPQEGEEESETDGEVVILKVEKQNEEDVYVTVDDEKEAEEIFEIFRKQNQDEFDFED